MESISAHRCSNFSWRTAVVNAAFLIMTSAALAGADPAPPPPPPAAPIVVSGSAGCTNCGAATTGCCGSSKAGLFTRLKDRFGRKSHDCGCAPAPAPSCCDTCNSGCSRPNLLDTLKARWNAKKHRNSCCTPCCDPCGGAQPATTQPGTGTTPPKEMPNPKGNKPKEKSVSIPLVPTPTVLAGSSPY